jgi:hypothetical protein
MPVEQVIRLGEANRIWHRGSVPALGASRRALPSYTSGESDAVSLRTVKAVFQQPVRSTVASTRMISGKMPSGHARV